jgi:hypothetical protein
LVVGQNSVVGLQSSVFSEKPLSHAARLGPSVRTDSLQLQIPRSTRDDKP